MATTSVEMMKYGAILGEIKWQCGIFNSVEELKASRSNAAILGEKFSDLCGLREFILERENRLEHVWFLKTPANFSRVEGFAEAMVSKLSTLRLMQVHLGEEHIQVLNAALYKNKHKLKLSTLVLLDCQLDDASAAAAAQLLKHIQRVQIFQVQDGAIDLHCFGKVLVHPECKTWDLRLCINGNNKSNLEWLGDAIASGSCRLRKLSLEKCIFPCKLIHALKEPACKLEGLELASLHSDNKTIMELANAIQESNKKLWFFQISESCLDSEGHQLRADNVRFLLHEGVLKSRTITHMVLWVQRVDKFSMGKTCQAIFSQLLQSPKCRLQSFTLTYGRAYRDDKVLEAFQSAMLDALEANIMNQLKNLELGPWQSNSLESRWFNIFNCNADSAGH